MNLQILQRGELIGERYEVVELLGRGGSAAVYRVKDAHTRKEWALKLILKAEASAKGLNPEGEIELLSKLSHPYLPGIVDALDGERELAIVMDYIEGRPLSEVLRSEGAQKAEDVLRWALQLADVLIYLHSLTPPVIYRDMKPGNIMLRPSGEIALLDFGIAARQEAPEGKEGVKLGTAGYAARQETPERKEGVKLGTAGYAAPEQLEDSGQIDTRTDIYCLGATLFHLLTGKKAGQSTHHASPECFQQLDGEETGEAGEELCASKKWEQTFGTKWCRFLSICMQRDPERRYQTAAEVREELLALQGDCWEESPGRSCGRVGNKIPHGQEGSSTPHARLHSTKTGSFLHGKAGSNGKKRKEIYRKMAIAAAVFGSIAGLAFAISGRTQARREQTWHYQQMLLEADALALTSRLKDEYLIEATKKYAEAVDLIPSREEAYLRLLDYCSDMGQTNAGLLTVCSHIDSGSGGIDHSAAVLFRVAELYFSGNPLDEKFRTDYMRAARYFAMIDCKEMPEATYYASIAEAMGSSSKKRDWKRVYQMLAAFAEYNEGLPSVEKRVRNRLLCAGVYTANRHAFEAAGVNAYGPPIRLLEQSLEDLNIAEQEGEAGVQKTMSIGAGKELKKQVLRNLAASLTAAAVSGEEAGRVEDAISCYEELLKLTEDAGEREELEQQIENVKRVAAYLKEEGENEKGA